MFDTEDDDRTDHNSVEEDRDADEGKVYIVVSRPPPCGKDEHGAGKVRTEVRDAYERGTYLTATRADVR